MNEGLYRGKKVEDGQWIKGGILFCKNGDRDTAWIVTFSDFHGLPMITEVRPETVAPWSGMRDKDGKDIFRDDILMRGDHRTPKSARFCVVKYGEFNCSCCHGVYGWKLVGNYADIRDFEGDMWSPKYKVVGNIHDNPELLEVK